MEHIGLLRTALIDEGMSVSPGVIRDFSTYQDILLKWNKKINLISRKDEARIVTRHFLQSLGLVKMVSFPRKARIMDLGSGAGFPGIPVKLVRPDLSIVLVESKRKKVLFLRHVVEAIHLKNVEIVQGRIEDLEEEDHTIDFIVSRAVTDLVTLAKWSKNLLKPRQGKLIVIKGSHIEAELKQLENEAPGLGIKAIDCFQYNPFPSVTRFKQGIVVSVEWG